MWITQEKYLEAANNNYKEWFIDNDYDIIFIPLIARDYLTAYLLNFTGINYTSPDLDYVLDKLKEYDNDTASYYSDLNIKFLNKIKDKQYYLSQLAELKDFVNSELTKLNRNDFSWVEQYISFTIKDKLYVIKKDYPNNMSNKHRYLFEAVCGGTLSLISQEEKK